MSMFRCLSTSISLGEIVDDGDQALVADIDDRAGLIDRLERIVSDADLRETIGRRGHALVQARFTWDAMTGELEDLLESLTRRDR